MAISNITILTEFRQEDLYVKKSQCIQSELMSAMWKSLCSGLRKRSEIFRRDKITVVDVQEFKSYLYNVKRNKPVGVNRKLSALESFCEFLVSTGHLKDNPAAKVKKIKQQKTAEVAALSSPNSTDLKNVLFGGQQARYSHI